MVGVHGSGDGAPLPLHAAPAARRQQRSRMQQQSPRRHADPAAPGAPLTAEAPSLRRTTAVTLAIVAIGILVVTLASPPGARAQAGTGDPWASAGATQNVRILGIGEFAGALERPVGFQGELRDGSGNVRPAGGGAHLATTVGKLRGQAENSVLLATGGASSPRAPTTSVHWCGRSATPRRTAGSTHRCPRSTGRRSRSSPPTSSPPPTRPPPSRSRSTAWAASAWGSWPSRCPRRTRPRP